MRLPWSTRNSRLDLSHPLLRGCYAYFTLGNDGRNLIPSGVEDAVAANGATFMSAKAGRLSAALDGVNDSLQVAAHSSLDQGGTWSYWINTSGAWGTDGGSSGGSRGAGIVLSRAQSASSANGVLMLISNAGLPTFICRKAGGTEVVNIVSTKSVTDGRWHHVAASFGLASGAAARLYVDGTQVASGSNSDAFSFSTSEPLYIGDSADTWWEEMIGNVSDVALFSRVVSPAEIRVLSDRPWKVFARADRPIFYSLPSGNITISLTGQSSTFSYGTLVPALSRALSGLSASFSRGTLIPALAKTLTGQSATFSGGTLTPVTGITVTLTGQSFTGTTGSLKADLAVSLLGQSVTSSYGTLIPSIAGDVSVNLAGLSALLSRGTLTASLGNPPETLEFSWANKKAKFSFKPRSMIFILD